METIHQKKQSSGTFYLLSGVAVGTALGLLFAPRSGSETRRELAEWGRRSKDKGREFISKASSYAKHQSSRPFGEEEENGAAREARKSSEPFVS